MKHQRTVYSLLDMIGDIGGLHDGLRVILAVVMSMVGGTQFLSDMSSTFFREMKHSNKYTDE